MKGRTEESAGREEGEREGREVDRRDRQGGNKKVEKRKEVIKRKGGGHKRERKRKKGRREGKSCLHVGKLFKGRALTNLKVKGHLGRTFLITLLWISEWTGPSWKVSYSRSLRLKRS